MIHFDAEIIWKRIEELKESVCGGGLVQDYLSSKGKDLCMQIYERETLYPSYLLFTQRGYMCIKSKQQLFSNMFSASPTVFFGHVNGILAPGRKNGFSVGVIEVAIFFLSLFLRFLAVVLKRIQLRRLK